MRDKVLNSPDAAQACMKNRADSGTKERSFRLLIALAVAAACFVCALLFTKLYIYDGNIDNYWISILVSGLYDEESGQCQYLHPLLSRGLRTLSRLLPGADAFMLTGHVLVFLELFWLTDLMLREKRKALFTAAVCLMLLLASVGLKLFNCNYTIQAASFAATGMLTLSYAQRRETMRLDILVGALFFAAGFMWRRQGALLVVPYIILETVFNLLGATDRRGAWRQACCILAPCLFLTGFLLLTDAAMNADEAHRLARQYDNSRIQIADFPTKDWEEIADEAGSLFTESDYNAARTWTLFDTERINAETMQEMAALGATTAFPFTPAGVLDAAQSAKKIFLGYPRVIVPGMLLASLSLCGLVLLPKYRFLEIVLCDLGTLTILLYFIILGRTPERFWLTVLVSPLSLVLFNLVMDKKDFGQKVFPCLLLLFTLCALILHSFELAPIRPQFALNARRNADESEYTELMENDAIYLWCTLGLAHEPLMRQGKLPSKELLSHMIPTGGWVYGQPYFTAHLERLGIPNPAAALLERDDVFLAFEYLYYEYLYYYRIEPTLALLEERAGGPVKMEQVNVMHGAPIFAVSAGP